MINQHELRLYERFFIKDVEFVVANISKPSQNNEIIKSTITARTITEKEEDAETFVFIKNQKFPWNVATKKRTHDLNGAMIIFFVLTTILVLDILRISMSK
jgi:hypothetical protein